MTTHLSEVERLKSIVRGINKFGVVLTPDQMRDILATIRSNPRSEMNKIDSAIDEGRKVVDQQLNTHSKMSAWIRLRDAAPELLAALELVIGSDPIRHILKLNHSYESGCTCDGCKVEAAIEKAIFSTIK